MRIECASGERETERERETKRASVFLEIKVDGSKRATLLLFCLVCVWHWCGLFSSLSNPFSFFLSFLSPRASETHTPRKTEQNKTNKNSSGASSVSVRPSAAVAPRASIPPALPRRRRSGGGNNSLLVARAEDEKKEGGGDFYNDERPVSFSLLLFSCFLSTFCPESVSKEEKDAAVYSFAHLRFSH